MERHCQVDVLGNKCHVFALYKMRELASFRLREGQSVIAYCGLIKSADRAPHLELFHHLVPVVAGPHRVPTTAEVVRLLSMPGEKALRILHRLESPHSAFPFAGRLMGVFCSVIESSTSAVFDLGNEVAMGPRVARQLIGDQCSRAVA